MKGGLAAAAALLTALLAAPAVVVVMVVLLTAIAGAATAQPTSRFAGAADIPPGFLALYVRHATACGGLDWALLAAIGKVETDHGRSHLPGVTSGENGLHAGGPLQFLDATFAATITRHPPPAGGAHPPSRYNPSDAVHTAAALLCDAGLDTLTHPSPSPATPGYAATRRAIWTYNHSGAYVDTVLAHAAAYRASTSPAASTASTVSTAADQGVAVVGRAGRGRGRWPTPERNSVNRMCGAGTGPTPATPGSTAPGSPPPPGPPPEPRFPVPPQPSTSPGRCCPQGPRYRPGTCYSSAPPPVCTTSGSPPATATS